MAQNHTNQTCVYGFCTPPSKTPCRLLCVSPASPLGGRAVGGDQLGELAVDVIGDLTIDALPQHDDQNDHGGRTAVARTLAAHDHHFLLFARATQNLNNRRHGNHVKRKHALSVRNEANRARCYAINHEDNHLFENVARGGTSGGWHSLATHIGLFCAARARYFKPLTHFATGHPCSVLPSFPVYLTCRITTFDQNFTN